MKYFSKLKLNAKGFAHVELVMIVVTIAVIGGIGSYVMLKRSHADVLSGSAICGSGYAYPSPYSLAVNNQSTITNARSQQGPARVFVYQNKSAQKLCAVLQSTGTANGVSKTMGIKLQIRKSNGVVVGTNSNSGTFKYYAGPVYVSYASTAGTKWRYNLVVEATPTMVYKGITYDRAYYSPQAWSW
jgi:hypothetical protein